MTRLEEQNSSLTTDLHVEATYRLTEELVAAQHRMQRRVQLLSEVVFETDANGVLVFLNEAWQQALDLQPTASIGAQLTDFVHPADKARLNEILISRRTQSDAVRPCLRFLHKTGADVWMEISLSFLADGGTVGAMRNVTRQRQTQAEIEKLSLVASFTDNLVIITDGDGRIEWVNEAFCSRTEYEMDEVTGRKPGDFLQGPETDRATVQRISVWLKEGRSFQSELVNYSKSGNAYWTSFQVTPIRDQQGNVERYISIQTDSTERRKTQIELELARERAEAASLAKTRFLANISHEMRTPLNTILGYSDLAMEANPTQPEASSYLGKVRDGAELLLSLITDLLDVSNLEAGQIDVERVPFHLEQCVKEALVGMRETAEKSRLAFTLEYDPALPLQIQGDPRRLRKILSSLTENAIKFTDSGEVRVSVKALPATGSQEDQLEIKVVDTGIGIVAEQQERVFERFERVDNSTTRKKGGVGIGLTMVRSLVQALGGSISLQSRPRSGSEFTVLLPMAPVELMPLQQEKRTAPANRVDLPHGGRPMRILIAEDTDTNFLILNKMLADSGIQSERAFTGKTAVESAMQTRYDLILMDVEMPEMDGLQAARLIREHERKAGWAHVPMLAFTAYASRSSRDNCSAAGCNGFLTKPIRKQELLDAVYSALGCAAQAESSEQQSAEQRVLEDTASFISVDPEFLEFVPMFMEHCHSQLQKLQDTISRLDAAQAARVGHDLKGCAPGIGFDEIGRLGAAIEIAAKGADFSALKSSAIKLSEHLKCVRYG